jgi:phenylpropionate dioxygenase-like ring-hydroxylating dioxygenase large terminal subunit
MVVLNGRCSHVGSNLAKGTVVGECLRCPLHGWEYSADGRCVRIPTSREIPNWARQSAVPVEEVGEHVFFFNRPEATFPFPQFEGTNWSELVAAKPFELLVDAPWYVASSNGFDLQHFRLSHDRELIDDPLVQAPHPLARRIVARFKVAGNSWRDEMTRRFSGPDVTMSITDWVGNLILVTASFAQTTTYGLLAAAPLPGGRTLARVVVMVPRRGTWWGRWLGDRLDASIRRGFIRAFLQSDVERTAGLQYHPSRLIGADHILREYLEWLERVHR